MTTKETHLTTKFIDDKSSNKKKYSCELSFVSESEDNNGESPEIGKEYKLRLFVGSDISNLTVFSTSGNATLGKTKTALVGDEDNPIYITLNGERTASLPYPRRGSVTFKKVGAIYRADSTKARGVSYTVVGESEIIVPENLYGVLKVSYITYYKEVLVISADKGMVMVVAVGNCTNGKIVSTSTSLNFNNPGEEESNNGNEDEDSDSCGLSIEVNPDDNGGATSYYLGKTYYARVFSGSDIDNLKSFSTNGYLVFSSEGVLGKIGDLSSDEDKDKIYVSWNGSKTASLPYIYQSGGMYKIIGTFFDNDGNSFTPSITFSRDTAIISKPGYGSARVSYNTIYDLYKFGFDELGPATLVVIDSSCGGSRISASTEVTAEEDESESSSSCCCSCSSCQSSNSYTAEATIVFKDFVTGAVLPGVTVSIGGQEVGQTDDSGSITIKGLKTGQAYSIKGTKEGYLNTDSDSLANDEFIILAK